MGVTVKRVVGPASYVKADFDVALRDALIKVRTWAPRDVVTVRVLTPAQFVEYEAGRPPISRWSSFDRHEHAISLQDAPRRLVLVIENDSDCNVEVDFECRTFNFPTGDMLEQLEQVATTWEKLASEGAGEVAGSPEGVERDTYRACAVDLRAVLASWPDRNGTRKR